jgi:hypothetical protein
MIHAFPFHPYFRKFKDPYEKTTGTDLGRSHHLISLVLFNLVWVVGIERVTAGADVERLADRSRSSRFPPCGCRVSPADHDLPEIKAGRDGFRRPRHREGRLLSGVKNAKGGAEAVTLSFLATHTKWKRTISLNRARTKKFGLVLIHN